MTNRILTVSDEKHSGQTFIHVDRNRGQIKKGEKYIFCEFDPGMPDKAGCFIGRWLCVDLEIKTLYDLTPSIAFLDKNCELDTYLEILTTIRKIKPSDRLVVATFSNEYNLKSSMTDAPIYN